MEHNTRSVRTTRDIYTTDSTQKEGMITHSNILWNTSFLFSLSKAFPFFFFFLHYFLCISYHKNFTWIHISYLNVGGSPSSIPDRPLTIFLYFAGSFFKIEYGGTHMKSQNHSLPVKSITTHWSIIESNHNLGVCIWLPRGSQPIKSLLEIVLLQLRNNIL